MTSKHKYLMQWYVCALWGIKIDDLYQRTRKKPIREARQVCMFMLQEYGGYTPRYAGEEYNLDRVTAIHAFNTVTDHYRHEEEFRNRVDMVIDSYYNNFRDAQRLAYGHMEEEKYLEMQ